MPPSEAKTYRTKDGSERILPGIGMTKNGQITTTAKIESAAFELVDGTKTETATQAPVAPAPPVQPTQPVTPTNTEETK